MRGELLSNWLEDELEFPNLVLQRNIILIRLPGMAIMTLRTNATPRSEQPVAALVSISATGMLATRTILALRIEQDRSAVSARRDTP